MNLIYQEILKRRRDMTEWLIHFTRTSDGGYPREVLRNILVEGRLKPGFAERGGRKTVYGPTAAVCFTEQPIGAFLEYLNARDDPTAMVGYGLLVHKEDVYIAGGRPVIYGLERNNEVTPNQPNYRPDRRLLTTDSLPEREQYRYVAFAADRQDRPLDWTHEREWRWPARESNSLGFFSLGCGPGLFRSRVHVFVDHDEDVPWLQGQILEAMAAGHIGLFDGQADEFHTGWWQRKINKVRVVSLDTARRHLQAGENTFFRFEDWPDHEKHPLLI